MDLLTSSDQNLFMVFQFGNRNTENVIFRLPGVFTRRSTRSQEAGTNGDESHRNLLISVNYAFQESPLDPNRNPDSRVGTIELNVPGIPVNRTTQDTNSIIEFATNIAFSVIAACTSVEMGTSQKTLDSLPRVEVIGEDEYCPICYDPYIVKAKALKRLSKDIDDDDDDDGDVTMPPLKKRCVRSSGSDVSVVSEVETTSKSHERGDTIEAVDDDVHWATKLPCGHIFGSGCIFEWLRSKSTCPLCRKQVQTDRVITRPPPRINLPDMEDIARSSSTQNPIVVSMDSETGNLVVIPTPGEQGGLQSPGNSYPSRPQYPPRRTYLSNANPPTGTDASALVGTVMSPNDQSNAGPATSTATAASTINTGVETTNNVDSPPAVGGNLLVQLQNLLVPELVLGLMERYGTRDGQEADLRTLRQLRPETERLNREVQPENSTPQSSDDSTEQQEQTHSPSVRSILSSLDQQTPTDTPAFRTRSAVRRSNETAGRRRHSGQGERRQE